MTRRRHRKVVDLAVVRAGVADLRAMSCLRHLSRRGLVRLHLRLRAARTGGEAWRVYATLDERGGTGAPW